METRTRSRFFVGMRNFDFENTRHLLKLEEEKKEKVNLNKEEWQQDIIDNAKKIDCEWIALIFHSRDEDSEGNLKELHVHKVARFKNPRDYKATRVAFGCEARNFTKGRSESSALLYLTHTTPQAIKDKKTRYNVQELIVIVNELDTNEDGKVVQKQRQLQGEELEQWYRIKVAGKVGENVSTEEEVARIIDELSAGEKDLNEVKDELKELFDPTTAIMCWVKNKRHFREAISEYYEAKYLEMLDRGRGDSFKLLYIQGMSAVGKTRFANKLARYYNKSKGVRESFIHNAPNDSKGSSYDFLSGYGQEMVTVFDDLKPTTFGYTEFLNLFEKERVAKYSSRFQNKPWFSELAIITKSTDIDEWTKKLAYSEMRTATPAEKDNILYQPRRRFSFVINLEMDKATIQAYQLTDKKTNSHKLVTIEEIKCKEGQDFHDEKFQRKLLKKLGRYLGVVEATSTDLKKLSLDKLDKEVKIAQKKAQKKAKELALSDDDEINEENAMTEKEMYKAKERDEYADL